MKSPQLAPMQEDARYKAACARLVELTAAKTKVDTRIAEIDLQLASIPGEVDHTSSHVQAAINFLNTDRVTAPDFAHLQDEHMALRKQRDALSEVLKEQSALLESISRVLSGEVSQALQAQHTALGKRMRAALRELNQIQKEDLALEFAASRAGYQVTFAGVLQWPFIGTLDDRDSLLSNRMRELAHFAD